MRNLNTHMHKFLSITFVPIKSVAVNTIWDF